MPSPADRNVEASSRPATWQLLQDIANEPDAAWSALLDKLDSRLRVLLHFRMTAEMREVCDEGDILQEVWVEAVKRLADFEYRGPGSLYCWLVGILRNKLLHAGRSAERLAPTVCSATAPRPTRSRAVDPSLAQAIERTRSGVTRTVWRRELEARVREILAALPGPEREVVLLKLYEGLSGREAAALLDVDESTVSLRFKRALQTCASRLREFAP